METAEAFLLRFFDAMHDWEARTAARRDAALISEHEVDPERSAQANAESIAELREIWKKFTTTLEPRRGLQFSDPPEYNRNLEVVLRTEPSPHGARVVTHQTHTGDELTLVYTLKKTEDGWRLVDKRVYIDDDGSEEPWDL